MRISKERKRPGYRLAVLIACLGAILSTTQGMVWVFQYYGNYETIVETRRANERGDGLADHPITEQVLDYTRKRDSGVALIVLSFLIPIIVTRSRMVGRPTATVICILGALVPVTLQYSALGASVWFLLSGIVLYLADYRLNPVFPGQTGGSSGKAAGKMESKIWVAPLALFRWGTVLAGVATIHAYFGVIFGCIEKDTFAIRQSLAGLCSILSVLMILGNKSRVERKAARHIVRSLRFPLLTAIVFFVVLLFMSISGKSDPKILMFWYVASHALAGGSALFLRR